jgi:hypothetical protein
MPAATSPHLRGDGIRPARPASRIPFVRPLHVRIGDARAGNRSPLRRGGALHAAGRPNGAYAVPPYSAPIAPAARRARVVRTPATL